MSAGRGEMLKLGALADFGGITSDHPLLRSPGVVIRLLLVALLSAENKIYSLFECHTQ